jgi:hypothetical protein
VRSLLVAVLLLYGCASDPLRLTVDVRTDYHPGLEFTNVVSSLSRAGDEGDGEVREESFIVEGSEDFLGSIRVAQFDDALSGPVLLRVRLVDAGGRIVARRRVELVLDQSFSALVLLTRNCAGVECPAPAGSPELSECLDARCVDPACTAQAPELCPPPCSTDTDCGPEPGCDARRCIEGACFCGDAPMLPDAGTEDADTGPPCECVPGETEDMTMPCGGCDSGTQTDTRTCGEDCQWGPFEPGSCMGAGCTPGDTAPCANGEPCGQRTCQADCTFGGCELLPGAQCFRIGPGATGVGTNYRCCGTYQWQFCLDGCIWSTACVSCDPTVGCPDCG